MIPDRTQAPEISAISSPKIPDYQELTIGRGVPLVTINQGTQPILLLDIEIPCGRFTEDQPGVTYFVAKMLTEGTQSKSAEEIAETFDFYGSHLEITPTLDTISIKLYCLKKFFPELLPLLKEMLMHSIFPEKELETLRRIRVQQIKQQHAKNNAFAGLKFREKLFGPSHPYGTIITEEMAREVSKPQILNAYSSFFNAPAFYLGGQVDEEDIDLLEKAFGEVHYSPKTKLNPNNIIQGESTSITKEGSTQASLRMGQFTISRGHKDIHSLKVTNTILGGFFGSRLMKNIREEKGLSYGIHSSFTHLDHSSYWCISTEVLKDQLELARDEILKEVEILRTIETGDEELNMVTNYMKGKFLTSFDSPFSSLQMIKTLRTSNLDKKYYKDFLSTLSTITPEKIKETARSYIKPEELLAVSIS